MSLSRTAVSDSDSDFHIDISFKIIETGDFHRIPIIIIMLLVQCPVWILSYFFLFSSSYPIKLIRQCFT